ncbi:beta-galactosidase [Radiobacillus sp. PE A8.2]|uniref:beta-galactosidase n=1 Tax=Radiobacillus sp. PE A8.2 TaxID=3380349 RepID=UPI00388D4804
MTKNYYGAALYPELWDSETVETDVKHMKDLGMNLARIGEFAWSTLEPEMDNFDMSMLTNAIELFQRHSIDVIVCTPTPTPPIWMTHNHSERLHHSADLIPQSHGSRQHICTNNPFFRERAAKIAEQIALAVKDYSNVIAIQLDNEFKCHVGPCYCAGCKQLWHRWLEEKYQTIDQLNKAWGTTIWSQTYLNFDQVPQPVQTPFLHNSSLVTTYQTFSMEKIACFAGEQADILRKYTDIPVTHNTGMFFDVDNEILANHLDFISFDTYTPASNYAGFMMNNDRWRYIKNSTCRYMLLETSTSYTGHLADYPKIHHTGYVPAEAFATYANGASAFSYWLFRGQRTGCEQPHGSVVSSWGEPTIGYSSVVETGNLLKQINPILQRSEPIEPKVAITYSDRARSFYVTEPGEGNDYKTLVNNFYQHLLDVGVERKLIPEGHELDGCNVLFSPFLRYISDEYLLNAKEFVEKGGVWVVGPMAGDRTAEHTWHTTGGLGEIGELAGVSQIMQFPATDSGHIGAAYGHQAELGLLTNVFSPNQGTTVKGLVTEGQAKDHAFITEKQLGKGRIILLGSMPAGEEGNKMLRALIKDATTDADLSYKLNIGRGIVVIPRRTKDGRVQLWMVNFTNENTSWQADKKYVDLLTEKQIEIGENYLTPFSYAVLEEVELKRKIPIDQPALVDVLL